MRILCVDDDVDTGTLLTAMLGQSGLEAASVSTAGGALRMMEHERFRLYVIDAQMPRVAGFTLCERIRAADKETPVVIFSGRDTRPDIDAARLAGANAYVVKPRFDELVAAVRRLLREGRDAPTLE